MKQETNNWILLAKDHYENAVYLLAGSRFSLSVYCAHQALEMVLKAAIVEFAKKAPPKIHKLDELARLSKLDLPKKWYEDLAEITRHYWKVRYPDFRQHVYTNKEIVAPTIEKMKEVYLWILSKLNQH